MKICKVGIIGKVIPALGLLTLFLGLLPLMMPDLTCAQTAERTFSSAGNTTATADSIVCPYCKKTIPRTDLPRHDQTQVLPPRGGDAREEAPSQPMTTAKSDQTMLFVVIGICVFIIAALLAYLFLLQPAKKRKPLLEAVKIVEADTESEFPLADEKLTQALTAGLKKSDIAVARFLQAYVRARLGKFPEADAAITELRNLGELDSESAYLDMWIQLQLENYENIEKIYNQYGSKWDDLLDAKMIMGIACLELGKKRWDQSEIEMAVYYFNQLQNLDVLHEYIPKHIDNHQVVLGIMDLFDKNMDEARRHFSGAITTAKNEGKTDLHGRIGMLLCDWKESDFPEIDDELAGLIEEIESTASSEPEETEKEGELEPHDPLLRNLLLWHAISMIYRLFAAQEKSGLADEKQEALQARLQKVIDEDAQMPDPHLLMGLVMYFFSYRKLRKEAVAKLQEAIDQGINVPEVLSLVDRENKLMEQEAKALELFLNLVKKYLTDETVPEALQEELKKRLRKYARFKDFEEGLKGERREEEIAPSIKDLQTRGQLLQKRIDNIVKPKVSSASAEDVKSIQELLASLEKSTANLESETRNLEVTEQKLMVRTGEFLFMEEEKTGESAASEAVQEG